MLLPATDRLQLNFNAMIIGEPTFYLKSCTDPKKERIIIMQLSLGRKDKLAISTGEKILTSDWDNTAQWPRGKKHQVIVHVLNRYKAAIASIIQDLKLNNIDITSNEIKWRLEKALGKSSKTKENTFTILFEKWRDGVKNQTILTSSSKKYARDSYKPLTSTLNILKEFEGINGPITFERVNVDFYSEFTNYLYNKGFSVNYVGIQFKHIKSFVKWAWENNFTKNEIWKDKRFRRVSENPSTIYLSQSEIEQIYRADIADETLSKHRYNFVLNCTLGLRFGDLQTFAKNANKYIISTDKGKLVSINNEKTHTDVAIPLHWIAAEILDKFKNELPRVPSNQKFNEYIKKIAELAKINKPIVVIESKGGHRKTATYPKFELITTHTARRSFATNLYLAKFPSQDIMKLTGHKTEKAFARYIRADALEVAYTMLDSDYFKK